MSTLVKTALQVFEEKGTFELRGKGLNEYKGTVDTHDPAPVTMQTCTSELLRHKQVHIAHSVFQTKTGSHVGMVIRCNGKIRKDIDKQAVDSRWRSTE